MLDAESWIPQTLQDIMLTLFNEVYSQIIKIISVLIILGIVLICISKHTNFFEKRLPSPVEFTDNTTLKWNQYSAINRIGKVIFNIVSIYWIYYFSINVILNKNEFALNFFNVKEPLKNELIIVNYITEKNLLIMNGVFWLNVLITIYFVITALFQIRISNKVYYIKSEEIAEDRGNKYIKLNTFVTKDNKGCTEIAILKQKNMKTPVFYLVSGQFASIGQMNKSLRTKSGRALDNNISYKVINSSENLDEIIYHFEFKKDSYQNDN